MRRPLNSVDAVLSYLNEQEQANRTVTHLELTAEEYRELRLSIEPSSWVSSGTSDRIPWITEGHAGQLFGIPIYITEDPFLRMAREYVEEQDQKLRVITIG